ncbi:MAG: sulfite exporter TauE/SafE family protein [Xanthobacteraceae bacterium]|nr:MAG: sulfite exporter TauE/SafE family protein [Xanthobacteraceae bacterium]
MEFLHILLLAVAGFAAGVVNAVAGGGTFFTFSALVAGGMPTLDANATSAVALTPANIASVAGYHRELRLYWREIVPFAAIGAVGGLGGGMLLIGLGDAGFRPLVPWLLLVATILFALSGRIRALIAPFIDGAHPGARASAYALMAVVAVYGGFFGAGMGIMMLAAMAIIEAGNFHKANTIKNVVSFFAQGLAIVLLIASGLVHWPQALVTMASSIAGGYLGVMVARRVPEQVVRAIVVTVGAALTGVFFLR